MANKKEDDDTDIDKIEPIEGPVTTMVSEGNQEVYRFLNSLYGNINTKSDITANDRALLIRLSEIINVKKSLNLDTTLEQTVFTNYLEFSLSLKRKSRQEAVEILKGSNGPTARQGFFARFRH